jgi:putative ABC transport system permease protein
MKTRFLISESLQALRSNLLRSMLTIVGIVVGIFAVTAMLALGAGVSDNLLKSFNSLSASGDVGVSGDVTYADLEWIKEQAYTKNILATYPLDESAQVVAFGVEMYPSLSSYVGDYSTIQSYEIIGGQVFDWNDIGYAEPVAVVSNMFADSVKEDTGRDVLGEEIIVGGVKYKVIGVIKIGSFSFGPDDGAIILPYGAVVGTLSSSKNFSSVAIMLHDATYFEIAGKAVLKGLNTSRQLAPDSDDMFSVQTSQSFIETTQSIVTMMSLFLGVVGGIALFVGGIGTMNMMLTTVTERTKEIGLRKAVGARDRDIMLQILIESVALTTLGGFIGILLSYAAALLANYFLADSFIKVLVNTQVVVFAALVAIGVGVIFGLYPARNASRLQPVDALRSE